MSHQHTHTQVSPGV